MYFRHFSFKVCLNSLLSVNENLKASVGTTVLDSEGESQAKQSKDLTLTEHLLGANLVLSLGTFLRQPCETGIFRKVGKERLERTC